MLDELLIQLKEARAIEAEARQRMSKVLDSFKESDSEYVLNSEAAYKAYQESERLEGLIRTSAVEQYKADGNKKPHEKVAIKIFKTFKIIDAEKVRVWAFSNLPAALKLDEKKVEKYSSEFGAVDGTETGEEARAQIATSL